MCSKLHENIKDRREYFKTNMDVFIKDPEKFQEKKDIFKKDGFDKMHILSDFDRTLTYGSIGGVKTPSIISMLRDGKHLSDDYAQKAHALYDKYHSFENNLNLSEEIRKQKMREWWNTHNQLLIESGVSRPEIGDIVEHGHVRFREGMEDFLDFTREQNIPLIIMSASGCGDAIKIFFEKIGKDYPNIHYVTNQFVWNEKGEAVSTKEPVIHSLNKKEIVLNDLPDVFNVIKERKNVILLGDSLSDLDMVTGFEYDNLMSVGFQNHENDSTNVAYEESFDVVLKGDGDFRYVDDLLMSLK